MESTLSYVIAAKQEATRGRHELHYHDKVNQQHLDTHQPYPPYINAIMLNLIAVATFSIITALISLGVGVISFLKLKTQGDSTRQGLKWVPSSLMTLFL